MRTPVHRAILAGVSAFALATPALAQVAAPAPAPAAPVTTAAADEALEDEGMVIVTGSRIARANLDASVPVTTLSAAELTATGEVSLGDTLNLLPAFRPTFSSQNSGRFIGTAGINALDLRGQGTARTLVLQNGRRHVTSQPGQNTVDVNTIPTDLVERVDVVTGGNSGIYGSDAVAGVVNFIMKRDFEGLGARAQAGISSRFDRPTFFGSITAGKNFADGRGNIAVNAEYSQSDPLYFRERDAEFGGFRGRDQFQLVQDTAFPVTEPAAGDGRFDTEFLRNIKNIGISTGGAYTSACPAASPTNAARRALNCTGIFNAAGTSEFGKVFVFAPDGSLVENVVQRDFRPFGSGNAQGGLGSTLRETGQLQTGTTRYAGNILAHYDISDGFKPFVEAKFVRTNSIQEGQPTFSSGALSPNFSINNPFLTPQARNTLVNSLAPGATTFTTSRFNVDFGGRGEKHTRDLYRVVVGAEGNFFDTWRYEAAFNYGRVDTFYRTEGNVATARFTNAVTAVRNPAGQIVCSINADAVTTNDDPSCSPLNIFGNGAPSRAALDYVLVDTTRKQNADQMNAIAYVSGDLEKLFTLPGGPIGFVVGGEWRSETSFSAFDAFTRSGATFLNAIGVFDPPRLTVWEGFGEIRIPVLKDMPFFQELTLEGSIRASDYNVGNTGTVIAFNAGGVWQPFDDLRIRGGYARAIRAPTQGDLFGANSQTFLNGLIDPCSQRNISGNPNRVANCAAGGVPTTQTFTVGGVTTTEPFTNVPNSGISGFQGGNPGLEAETSTSWTVGGVIRPSFIPGLVLSVDYYDISLRDAINTILAQTVINQCYDSPDGIDNQFCRAITRNPNGTFAGQGNVQHAGTFVEFPLTGSSFLQGAFNYARQTTRGIDFDLGFQSQGGSDWRFNARAIVSYLLNRDEFTSLTEPNRATQEKLTQGDPEWNAQLRLGLGYKDVDFSWNMRYVGKQTVALLFADQNVEQGRPPTNADRFPQVFYPEVSYHDLRLQTKVGPDHRFYIGVDNVFDQLPPLDLLGTGAGDAIYTNTGRFFYVGVEMKF